MKLLIICGPTATGKTKLASSLAKKFSGQLISADSRQVYQDMDIVTGKDRPQGVSIWGYDIVRPDEEFSVAHFVSLAEKEITRVRQLGKLPIIVGGTGFWLKSLVNPPATINIPPQWRLRQQLEKFSAKQLLNKLRKLDSRRAAGMNQSDRKNPRRLIRAIEVALYPGPIKSKSKVDILWIGLTATLKVIDERIDKRVRERIKAGAIKEWENLCSQYDKKLPSMTAIGYRELPNVDRWRVAEKQYARRQLTWFKKEKTINWFDINRPEFEVKVVEKVGNWYTN